LRRLSWRELRDVCLLAGCAISRIRGDHLMMTKPGMRRPIVIKMDRDLGEDIVQSCKRTLGLTTSEFESLLDQVRGR
jgi:hypothetical protein